MILQRLSQSIRKQDWFTVLIETLIVVLGVFLGIQLGNWNEARAGQRLGEEYVERLIVDLRADLHGAQNLAHYYAEVLEAVIETDRLLSLPDPDAKALVINAYRATEIALWPQSKATWEQIVSSSHLSLLPDRVDLEPLNLYFGYDQAYESYEVLENSDYRKVVRSIIPITVQMEIRAGCSDILDENGSVRGFVDPCVVDVPPDVFAATAERLKSDSRVIEALGFQFSELQSALNNLTGNVDYIEKSISTLSDIEAPE
ncbi:DUF6090 family protein [Henriciella sp. AS95]|uniref:DUF6090 family protein n=1 Tax=Henriciella sp. AS95 TaxID=3135782 RepID=UPI00316E9604